MLIEGESAARVVCPLLSSRRDVEKMVEDVNREVKTSQEVYFSRGIERTVPVPCTEIQLHFLEYRARTLCWGL
jgi:hypothetical protein